MRPADMPPVSRWADRPHGTRLRYVSGCRCVPCRAANSRYETRRARLRAQGQWNGLVDAAPARRHILALGTQGMGYKLVADRARVATSVVAAVRAGRKRQIRAATEKALLGVRLELASGALVPAAETWRLLDQLVREGYPKRRLARFLGQRGAGLQVSRDQVTVKTAGRVARLHARLTAEARS